MSEYRSSYNENERHFSSPSLETFRNNLSVLTNEISLGMAFQQYLATELEMSETEADLLHVQLQQNGVISEIDDYDEDKSVLKDELRIALFTEIRPRYLARHTTDEYDVWLGEVMGTMLADNSRHDLDVCLRTNGPCAGECEQGKCPIRVIDDEVISAHMNPDFMSFEYITDHHRMHREVEILLTHAMSYGVTPDRYGYTLARHYSVQCNEYFGRRR